MLEYHFRPPHKLQRRQLDRVFIGCDGISIWSLISSWTGIHLSFSLHICADWPGWPPISGGDAPTKAKLEGLNFQFPSFTVLVPPAELLSNTVRPRNTGSKQLIMQLQRRQSFGRCAWIPFQTPSWASTHTTGSCIDWMWWHIYLKFNFFLDRYTSFMRITHLRWLTRLTTNLGGRCSHKGQVRGS